jgi:hypothetical protein
MLDRITKVVLLFVLLYVAIMSATVFRIMSILKSMFNFGGESVLILLIVITIIYTKAIMMIIPYFLKK